MTETVPGSRSGGSAEADEPRILRKARLTDVPISLTGGATR